MSAVVQFHQQRSLELEVAVGKGSGRWGRIPVSASPLGPRLGGPWTREGLFASIMERSGLVISSTLQFRIGDPAMLSLRSATTV